MQSDRYESRKNITFAQAEGKAALPTQLSRTAMPRTLRARLLDVLHQELQNTSLAGRTTRIIGDPWREILRDEYISRRGNYSTGYYTTLSSRLDDVSKISKDGNYVEVYDFLQHILRNRKCSTLFEKAIDHILISERASYRIVGGDTFVPIGSEEEAAAIVEAFSATETSQFVGAHSHLKKAASYLGSGDYADSVRESIHAVEAVARTLEPSAELSKALGRLEASTNLHGAMKRGFAALYGYTSDEGGIRHPLLEAGDAKVDEADAIFMIGACASFVTYLIAKKRSAGLEDG